MKNLLAVFTILCLALLGADAKHYAVLVAGSNEFYNYRHQSDIFHAYQILKSYGVLPADIITFAYDDIANDPSNPFPGKVFNKPSKGPGKDVYKGVKIDYSGDDVTPQNFLNVLEGKSAAVKGKKVLKSTAEDNVFIYFADHGATGLIAFPNDYLYATDFMKTLKFMHAHKTYKEMVIYIEACESGSMFSGILPANISIYSTTAANPDESSWATYCSPDDMVNGTEIGSCLGDLYSVNFLENLESVKPTNETLVKQFQVVKKETTESSVMQYGSLTIDKEEIADFQADSKTILPMVVEIEVTSEEKKSLINSRNVKLAYLQRKHEKYLTEETNQALIEEMESIQRFDNIFAEFTESFGLETSGPAGDIDFDCLKFRVAMFEALCGKFTDYGLKYVRHVHFTCTQSVSIFDYETTLVRAC